jgi:hypothetical protein
VFLCMCLCVSVSVCVNIKGIEKGQLASPCLSLIFF